MGALIDRHRFGNAVGEALIGIVPARFEFAQRDTVRRISVHFVGTHVRENAVVRPHLPISLEQVQSAARVDVEIVKRPLRREVVARLRRRMHHHIGRERRHQFRAPHPVANVDLMMNESGPCRLEPPPIPGRYRLRSEKIRAHVVVGAMHHPSQRRKNS